MIDEWSARMRVFLAVRAQRMHMATTRTPSPMRAIDLRCGLRNGVMDIRATLRSRWGPAEASRIFGLIRHPTVAARHDPLESTQADAGFVVQRPPHVGLAVTSLGPTTQTTAMAAATQMSSEPA